MMDRHEFQEYFSNGGISRHWLLVRSPLEIGSMKCVSIGELDALFEESLLAWSEPELPIPGHKVHPDVMAYHQYVAKFCWSGCPYFVRFTVRESRSTPKSRNDVHAATISRVTLYKMESATSTGLGHNQAEDPAPFTDNKLSYFFAAVKAVEDAALGRLRSGEGRVLPMDAAFAELDARIAR